MLRHRPPEFALIALACAACAVTPGPKLAYTVREFGDEIARRAPGIPSDEVVVPFEVDPAQIALARKATGDARSARDRARLLSEALFADEFFGVRYAWSITTAAPETLRSRQGNCLGLASAFVGLARAIGLDAFFIDASTRVHETRYAGDGLVVNAGHVTAMVRDGDDDIGLDFAREGRIVSYRVLSDVEALAHFYNNRGYDLMDRASEQGRPVEWASAARQFQLATEVLPSFAEAWNNIGIAHARLGLRDQAIRDYRFAVAQNAGLAAPRNNLGLLLLEDGDVEGALAALREAATLEPRGAHIRYNLASARLRHGDRRGAIEELRRALSLRDGYPAARELLERLTMENARDP